MDNTERQGGEGIARVKGRSMRTMVVVAVVVSMGMVLGCQEQKREEVPQVDVTQMEAEGTGPGEPAVQVQEEPAPAVPPQPEATASSQTYTMKAGDTLYSLARRFYGDGKLWTKIYEANKDKIRDVSDIPVGMVLVIPPK